MGLTQKFQEFFRIYTSYLILKIFNIFKNFGEDFNFPKLLRGGGVWDIPPNILKYNLMKFEIFLMIKYFMKLFLLYNIEYFDKLMSI